MKNRLFIGIISTIFCIVMFSCATKTPFINTSRRYTDIHHFGAYGDGQHNDQPAIQRAFRSGANLYFPKGRYLLKTKTDQQSLLLITERGTPRNITFAEGAILVVSPDQPKDYFKPAVIRVVALKRDIPYIRIEGLTIEGNRNKHSIKNPGLVVVDKPGTRVGKLILRNVTLWNLGGGGVHTQAMVNNFKHINCRNNGMHDIGIINYGHQFEVGTFYLKDLTSIDNDAYSIDFSGPKDKNGKPYPGFAWRGSVKKVYSQGAKYGIKTAGNWDLKMEDVTVEGSDNHGFFINVDAKGHKIEAKHMILKNNKGNALNLRGITDFEGEDIYIENCGKGILDNQTNIVIRDLTIKAGPLSRLGIQIGGGVHSAVIDGFQLSGFKPPVQYPVRIKGKHVVLKNGVLKNNQSVYEFLVYPEAGKVVLDDIKFEGHTNPAIITNGVRTLQEGGMLTLEHVDFRRLTGIAVRGDKEKITVVAPRGLHPDTIKK